jgi:hypothetical protein
MLLEIMFKDGEKVQFTDITEEDFNTLIQSFNSSVDFIEFEFADYKRAVVNKSNILMAVLRTDY